MAAFVTCVEGRESLGPADGAGMGYEQKELRTMLEFLL